jgi:hypothetical protein
MACGKVSWLAAREVARAAVMPLSWDFIACWFASFGRFDERQPEQRRNRSAVDAGMSLIGATTWCSSSMSGDRLGVNEAHAGR